MMETLQLESPDMLIEVEADRTHTVYLWTIKGAK